MSFDRFIMFGLNTAIRVSIPFDQGNVFRPNVVQFIKWGVGVSIPFDQGNVFRQLRMKLEELGITSQSLSIRAMSFDNTNTQQKENIMSLNPFRSGQCLSTVEHGNDDFLPEQSQSLSIRAMSFD